MNFRNACYVFIGSGTLLFALVSFIMVMEYSSVTDAIAAFFVLGFAALFSYIMISMAYDDFKSERNSLRNVLRVSRRTARRMRTLEYPTTPALYRELLRHSTPVERRRLRRMTTPFTESDLIRQTISMVEEERIPQFSQKDYIEGKPSKKIKGAS